MSAPNWYMPIVYDIPHDILYMPRLTRDAELLLCINRAGIVSRTPDDFRIRRNETYGFSVVHCVTAGRGSLHFREKDYPLEKGTLFALGPGECHEYCSDPGSPLGLCWIELHGANSKAMVRRILRDGGPVYQGDVFDRVMPLCSQLIVQMQQPQQWVDVSLILYQVLTELLKAAGSLAGQRVTGEDASDFAKILTFIDQNLDKQLTLSVLAAQFGYNATYLARKFSAQIGTPPAQYILRQRLVCSYQLLLCTDLPLESIAAQSGFYDTSHFIARFKQAEGITPSAYRRQNKGLAPSTR